MAAPRIKRIDTVRGLSLYSVSAREPSPTFNRGDGYDDGRNLLGALLIGPSWRHVGYVVGRRGEWHAYPLADWIRHRDRRRSFPVCQFAPRSTVAEAADLIARGCAAPGGRGTIGP